MSRSARWLIFAPAAILAFASTARASDTTLTSGLTVTGYSITEVPPARNVAYPICGEGVYANINWTWDWEQNHLGDCGWDWFMVRFQGFVTIPEGVSSVRFAVASDDGGLMTINGNTFGQWQDQGCSVTYDARRTLPTGEPLPLDFWFYENGGGTCAMLFWQLNGDNQDWAIVPAWAFTTESTPPTTTSTTTVPSTTVPVTTTTSTTVQETTTTVSETTSTTVDTSVPEQSTSTVDTEPQTTTTESTTTTTPPPPPAPTQVVPITSPDTGTTTSTTTPSPTSSDAPVEETTLETAQLQTTTESVSVPDTPTLDSPSTTVTPPVTLPEIVTPEVAEEATVAPEEVLAELNAGEQITQAEALAVATSPEAVSALTPAEAEQVFAALSVSELSDNEITMLIEAVQDAPTEVREAFEEQINVFSEGFDNYVPLDSVITVGARRTLIAVTAGATLTAVGTKIRH